MPMLPQLRHSAAIHSMCGKGFANSKAAAKRALLSALQPFLQFFFPETPLPADFQRRNFVAFGPEADSSR